MVLSEDEPPLYYDHYGSEALQNIIDTQRKIIEYQKKQKTQSIYFKF